MLTAMTVKTNDLLSCPFLLQYEVQQRVQDANIYQPLGRCRIYVYDKCVCVFWPHVGLLKSPMDYPPLLFEGTD